MTDFESQVRAFDQKPVVRKDVLAAGFFFAVLFLWSRSPQLTSDGEAWVAVINKMDPREEFYGFIGHFFQAPFLGFLKRVSSFVIAGGVDARWLLLGYNFVFVLTGIVVFGCFCAERLKSRIAFFVACIILGGSLVTWTQWNGEYYAGALGFMAAGFWFAQRRKPAWAGAMYAMAVLSHLEFCFMLPALIFILWGSAGPRATAAERLRPLARAALVAMAVGMVLFLSMSYSLGRYRSFAGLCEYLFSIFGVHAPNQGGLDIFRVLKGLLAAYSISGNYLGDLVLHRLELKTWRELLAVATIPVIFLPPVLLACFAGLGAGIFAALALVPVEALFNLRFFPTNIEYHQAAFLAISFLFSAGACRFLARGGARRRVALVAGYLALFLGVNLFGSLLPSKSYGISIAERDVKFAAVFGKGNAALLHCMNSTYGATSDFTIERFARQPDVSSDLPKVRQAVLDWVGAELGRSRQVYVLGKACLGSHWQILARESRNKPLSEEFTHFSFSFLEAAYVFEDLGLGERYLDWSNQQNPFSWQKATLYRLVPRKN